MIGLDIETAPTDDELDGYALQPWRVIEGTAKITALSLAKSNGESLLQTDPRGIEMVLAAVRTGKFTCTWNGVFDVSFLIAAGHDVSGIKWVDAMLLWKWHSNSQRMEWQPAWSLADGAIRWLKDWPHLDKFLEMKHQEEKAGVNDQYWELRCKLDALVTVMIAERIWQKLTPQQQRSASITMQCIVPTARSWVNGIKLNYSIMREMQPAVTEEMMALEAKLHVTNPEPVSIQATVQDTWTPSKILRSPQQLGVLLYDGWGLECTMYTDGLEKAQRQLDAASTDAEFEKAKKKVLSCRATSKAALTYLADHDDRVLDILRWRELNTQLTKFIESPIKAKEYLKSEIVHPAPKLFSTYTGRMTYSSKTKQKYHTGVALHQWPRNKKLRELIHV